MGSPISRRRTLTATGTALLSALAGCTGVLGGGSGTEPGVTGSWPQFRHDAARTGATDATPPTGEVEVAWKRRCQVEPQARAAVAEWFLLEDGTEYHSCGQHVTAGDAESGDQQWATDIGFHSSPVVHDGTVYATEQADVDGEIQKRVVALDADTGEESWHVVDDRRSSQSLAFAEGSLYHAANTGLSKIAVESRERVWEYSAEEQLDAPAVVDEVAYVTVSDLGAVDAVGPDGARRWRGEVGESGLGFTVVGDGLVYVPGIHAVHALDAGTGEYRWTAETRQVLTYAPALAADRLFVSGKKLHALDATTGEELWTASPGGVLMTNPAVAGDLVIVGDAQGTLAAFDVTSGERRWAVELNGELMYGPVVVDETVLVSNEFGRVFRVA
ncbi:outer membrane protein assembly factor BamB family protein [Haloarchaeobius sp. DT45]|uniref:outer membrane protein assembly factor BamB family protein n=1 Tax=Haloarchaeobius sp. DT45 TaxID=3446116 RepID=UPI003F6B0BE2